LLCELGHINDAEAITRSLFESFLYAIFVLNPPPEEEISKPITKLIAIDSRIQDCEFRTMLFAVWPNIHRGRHLEKIANYNELADLRTRLPESQQDLADIRDQIGEGWFKHLLKSQSFPGLGVKGLSLYSGQEECTTKYILNGAFQHTLRTLSTI
jgi:hypothetical protein